MSQEVLFEPNLPARHRKDRWGLWLFQTATLVGIVVLMALLYNIINNTAGIAAIEYKIYPYALGLDLDTLAQEPKERLITILETYLPPSVRRTLEREKPLAQRTQEQLAILVLERVLRPKVVTTWPLVTSLLHTDEIIQEAQTRYPRAELRWMFWLNKRFLTRPQSSDPIRAGVRTAILGSLWLVGITALTALPLGVATAIYLEEYARKDRWFNRLIQVNINNLAGVPSIIYGILGLAIFVRALEPITSGAVFGAVPEGVTASGR
ncbi:MAG: phosphate ABC transporter permease, partial [Chloroflexi bacterium]|nr:phosphate ABC transporter permease [Chloroflexota bacterium]